MKNQFDDLAQLIAEFSQIYADYAKTYQLSFNELHFLYYINNHNNHAHANEISKRWSIPKQTINSMINKYKNAGIIEVNNDPDDKRKKILSLTPNGQKFVSNFVDELTSTELAVQKNHLKDFAELLTAFKKIKDDFKVNLNK